MRFANQVVGDSCPHCQVRIQPYHVSSSNVSLGPNFVCFRRIHHLPPPPPPPNLDEWLEYFRIPQEPDDDPFLRYVSNTLPVSGNDTELEALPSTTNTDLSQENTTSSTCTKPVSV